MLKIWLSLTLILILGAGCSSKTQLEGEVEVDTSSDQQIILTKDFRLEIGPSYALQKDHRFVRIQNFVSQEDPEFVYPDDAFFLEIYHDSEFSLEEFTQLHGLVDEVTLDEETVLRGTNRTVVENSWPGHSYLHDDKRVVMYLYYLGSPGGDLAEDVIQSLNWK